MNKLVSSAYNLIILAGNTLPISLTYSKKKYVVNVRKTNLFRGRQ